MSAGKRRLSEPAPETKCKCGESTAKISNQSMLFGDVTQGMRLSNRVVTRDLDVE